MTTTIKWERGVAGQVAAHLLSDDGGHALVHCMIPGGKPRFMARPDAREDCSIVGAPTCDSFKAFKAFVVERFGDDSEDGHASYASAAILLGIAATSCAVVGQLVSAAMSAGVAG